MEAKDIRVDYDVSTLNFKIDGIRYRWYGGFGAVLISKEWGKKPGDLRRIGNVVFKVSYVHGTWISPTVCWIPDFEFSAEWIRRFLIELIGIPQWMVKE